jgi:hypothetical protein
VITAHAQEDMRRHVDDVTRSRREFGKTLGARHTLPGIRARLDEMDVEMIRARMRLHTAKHALDGLHGLPGGGLQLLLRRPIIPRRGVHQRLGEQRQHLVVVAETPRHLAHCVGVGQVKRRAIFRRLPGVTFRQRVNERLFLRAGLWLEGDRALHRFPRGLHGFGKHRRVDVRPVRVGDAPVRHGAIGIELRRRRERADGLAVVEVVEQRQALVEVTLRQFILRGDLPLVPPQPLEQRRDGLGVGGADGRDGEHGKQGRKQEGRFRFHKHVLRNESEDGDGRVPAAERE